MRSRGVLSEQCFRGWWQGYVRARPAKSFPTADLMDRGIALYADRADKHWSLTDCISFIVMEDRGIRDALTGDHHFRQAGFHSLLA